MTVGVDDIQEAHDVGVRHLLEKRDLADSSGGNPFIFSLKTNFLESNDPVAILKVFGFVDDSVRSCKNNV